MNSNFKLSLRYYISTLSIAFLVLTVFVMYILFTNPPEGFSTPGNTNNATGYLPSDSENMSIFLTIGSTTNSAPHTVALLYFDPVGGQIPVISIPPRCLVQKGEKTDTLENVFLRDGIRGAKQAFEQYSGITIDRYLATTEETFASVLDFAGRVESEMPYKLQLVNGVTVNKGLQSLDGIALCKVLETVSKQNDTTTATILTSQLVAESVNLIVPMVGNAKGERAFNILVNNSETDISYKDYAARIKATQFMDKLSGNPSYGLILQGRLNDGKNTFTFSEKSLTQLGEILSETV